MHIYRTYTYDSFLLHKENTLLIWNSNDADNRKKEQVHILARHIKYSEKRRDSTQVDLFVAPANEFLAKFRDNSKASYDSFMEKIYVDDKNLEKEINKSTELLEYIGTSSGIKKKNIGDRP